MSHVHHYQSLLPTLTTVPATSAPATAPHVRCCPLESRDQAADMFVEAYCIRNVNKVGTVDCTANLETDNGEVVTRHGPQKVFEILSHKFSFGNESACIQSEESASSCITKRRPTATTHGGRSHRSVGTPTGTVSTSALATQAEDSHLALFPHASFSLLLCITSSHVSTSLLHPLSTE
jgi:hypothetical protein